MTDWLILLAYLATAYFTWRRIYVALYRDHRRKFSVLQWTHGDRLFGVIWGGFVAFWWPVVWVGYGAWLVIKSKPVEATFARLERWEDRL